MLDEKEFSTMLLFFPTPFCVAENDMQFQSIMFSHTIYIIRNFKINHNFTSL